jgi:two-component system, cell cycle sensor histidine kinase and response regulator CckA
MHLSSHDAGHPVPPDAARVIEELRTRLDTYDLALQAGGIGAWEWDARTDRIRWSHHLEELVGLAPGTFDGRYGTFLSHVHPEDVDEVSRAITRAMTGEAAYDVEFRVIRPLDEQVRWMHATAVVLRGPGGRVERIVGNQVDVTDRKAAELQLRETADLLEYVLDTSPIVLFAGRLHGEEFVPDYVSSNSERVQGWSPEAFLSSSLRWTELLHPDDVDHVMAANRRALSDGQSEWATRLLQPDGQYGSYRTVLRVNRDASGAASYVGCTLDVTESHRMEQQLQQAQKMEAVGQLAGGVAHDFNNLLLVISGYAEVARAASAPGCGADKALGEVERAARQATSLVQQLLTFSRRHESEEVTVDIAETVHGLRDLLDTTAGERIRLAVSVIGDGVRVRLGQGQLEQVLLNLVVNARDAMPRGGDLTIAVDPVDVDDAVGRFPTLTAGTYARIVVSDTGEGMTPETKARAIEPFFTTKPVGLGTGLGLSTVYGIVSTAGGAMALHSIPNQGTSVELYLPRQVEVDPPDSLVAAPAPQQANSAENGRRRLLLVEDQPQVRALLSTSLERLGYAVLTAVDGADALSIVEREQPELDLVITDVVMPELNGFELAERLGSIAPELGVLFMSGYADTGEDDPRASGRGFLQKPFSIAELSTEVERILTG